MLEFLKLDGLKSLIQKKEKRTGLYLGANSIGAAVLAGKEVISLARFEFSPSPESEATSDESLRWESLVNKALRDVGSSSQEVYISLSDRDFIFRPLEMPLMDKKEIESSLVYEIEKYIPFKIDKLLWDYGYVSFFKKKKINLSFVGIKENNILKINETLARLKVKAAVIEPSCLSLVRVLKSLKRFSKVNDFALLDFGAAESYLTFFQNGLPIFNRYLSIPRTEEAVNLDKFIEAVNISFQYFRSEFKAYDLDRVIILGDKLDNNLSASLKENLGLEIEPVSLLELTSREGVGVEGVKALGIAGRDHYPYEFKPLLRKTAEFSGKASLFGEAPPLKWGFLGFLASLGAAVSIILALALGGQVAVEKDKLRKEEDSIGIPVELKEFSWPKRQEILRGKEKVNQYLTETWGSFVRFTGFFEELGRSSVLPEGLWLDDLDLSKVGDKYKLVLKGSIFRNDEYEERRGLDKFIANLKKSKAVSTIFPSIELESSERSSVKEFYVTQFVIRLQQ